MRNVSANPDTDGTVEDSANVFNVVVVVMDLLLCFSRFSSKMFFSNMKHRGDRTDLRMSRDRDSILKNIKSTVYVRPKVYVKIVYFEQALLRPFLYPKKKNSSQCLPPL